MPDLPTGTVTFLFTDIEGSTKLWEHYPEAMRFTLAQHDVLIRAAIETNGGIVFKTIGDAFCAAFANARDAVAAAVQAQNELNTRTEAPIIKLRVRMSLHTGWVEARHYDYFGPTVNRVARLLAVLHGGQIALTSETANAVGEHLPEDIILESVRYF